jgi:hypothetical protein
MEFLGCREYRQGDNPRHIHAPSWARIGAPIDKEFREEYAHHSALVVDVYTPPMAQKRFAAKPGLDKIAYLSDYRSGAFGRKSGLLLRARNCWRGQ